jgi:hypothetical protein
MIETLKLKLENKQVRKERNCVPQQNKDIILTKELSEESKEEKLQDAFLPVVQDETRKIEKLETNVIIEEKASSINSIDENSLQAKKEINIFEEEQIVQPSVPKGFFDDPDREETINNKLVPDEQKELLDRKFNQQLKSFNQFLADELVNFNEENLEEEREAYEDKINDEVDIMIELSEKANKLIKKSKVRNKEKHILEEFEDEFQVLKKKRNMQDIDTALTNLPHSSEKAIDIYDDIFDLNWKSKDGL